MAAAVVASAEVVAPIANMLEAAVAAGRFNTEPWRPVQVEPSIENTTSLRTRRSSP